MRIALPPEHRLRQAPRVGLADLAEEPFVLWPRFLAPGLYDAIIQRCFGAGFTPRIRVEAPEKATAIAFVAAGLGVTLTPASLSQIHPGEVAYRPIADAPFTAPLAIATRRGERDPAIHRVLKLTQGLAEA